MNKTCECTQTEICYDCKLAKIQKFTLDAQQEAQSAEKETVTLTIENKALKRKIETEGKLLEHLRHAEKALEERNKAQEARKKARQEKSELESKLSKDLPTKDIPNLMQLILSAKSTAPAPAPAPAPALASVPPKEATCFGLSIKQIAASAALPKGSNSPPAKPVQAPMVDKPLNL